MLLIFTNAQIARGGGQAVTCPECDEHFSMGIFADGVTVDQYESIKEVNNLLDEMKLQACLDGIEKKSLEEIERFFKK